MLAGIALVSGLSSFTGYTPSFGGGSPQVLAGVQGVAAGAILAMVIDTMAPERAHDGAGLIAAFGLRPAFGLLELA